MKFYQTLDTPAKVIFGGAIMLIAYGYLCRPIHLYFFWESLIIGWELVVIGLLFLLISLIKIKKNKKKPYVLEGIGTGFLIFILIIQSLFYIVLPNTDAYLAAKKYISNNDSIKKEVGNIRSFIIVPTGSIAESSGSQGQTGQASLILIVKGDKKFKDLKIYMGKQADADWEIEYLQ